MRKNEPITLQADTVNTLLPKFLQHLFWNSIIFLLLYLVYLVIDKVLSLGYNFHIILIGITITLLFSLMKIIKDFIIVKFTIYKFYPAHVEHNFKFIREENHSVNYEHITDIEVKKSLWDRICGVGDLIFHTANEKYGKKGKNHLILRNIKHPEKIKEEIYKKIRHTHR